METAAPQAAVPMAPGSFLTEAQRDALDHALREKELGAELGVHRQPALSGAACASRPPDVLLLQQSTPQRRGSMQLR